MEPKSDINIRINAYMQDFYSLLFTLCNDKPPVMKATLTFMYIAKNITLILLNKRQAANG